MTTTLSRIITAILLVATAVAQDDPNAAPLPAARPRPRLAADLAAQTVVLYNENDLDSVALAGFYQEKRDIPVLNLVGVKVPPGEEISRDDYDRTIAEPLRKIFVQRGWWRVRKDDDPAGRVLETKIRFVAVMRGIPLKIKSCGPYEGDVPDGEPEAIFIRNECALDSELALLGLWSRRISGILANPYYRDDKVIQDTELTSQLLVCRLDAPTPAIVRRMIEDTIATEKTGLRGLAYVDARGLKAGPLADGDRWLEKVAADFRENGIPVILDNGPALFPAPYPMRHPALYFGWYNEKVAGPFASKTFKFPAGAVAVHLHSFSASTLRGTERGWCGPMLASGACATIGNTYEPYLGLTSHLNVFSQRLREGFTFAEATTMSQRFLSWMTTCVGDPLYRPFAAISSGKPDLENEWDAYRAGVRTWLKVGRESGISELNAAAKRLKSGIIFEGLGLLYLAGDNPGPAISIFKQAREAFANPDDRVRVAIHEYGAIRQAKGPAEAKSFLHAQIAEHKSANSLEILTLLEADEARPKPPIEKKP